MTGEYLQSTPTPKGDRKVSSRYSYGSVQLLTSVHIAYVPRGGRTRSLSSETLGIVSPQPEYGKGSASHPTASSRALVYAAIDPYQFSAGHHAAKPLSSEFDGDAQSTLFVYASYRRDSRRRSSCAATAIRHAKLPSSSSSAYRPYASSTCAAYTVAFG